jgi:hypothetical protein
MKGRDKIPKQHGNNFECDSLDNINKFKTSIKMFRLGEFLWVWRQPQTNLFKARHVFWSFNSDAENLTSYDHSYSILSKTETEVKDSSCQTDLSLKDKQELERCRKKMDSKDELLMDLFVSKVTDCDRSIQQFTGLPPKPVFEGIFSEFIFKYMYAILKICTGK